MVDIIKVGGDEEYRKDLFSILVTIYKNPVGKVIIDLLHENKKQVSIQPVDREKLEKSKAAGRGEYYANTGPVKGKEPDSAPKGASERGPVTWFRGDPDNPYTRGKGEDERFNKVPKLVGTGAGSDVVIEFSPELIGTNWVWGRYRTNVLVHELVHALRDMQGLHNPVPTEDPDWMNEEEFWACTVQNVYMSAAGSTRLRRGYGDYETLLDAPLNTSSGFLAKYEALFKKHAVSWGQVYMGLAMNTAPFNPFREFVGRRK